MKKHGYPFAAGANALKYVNDHTNERSKGDIILFKSIKSKVLSLLMLAVVILIVTNVIDLVTSRQILEKQLQSELESNAISNSKMVNELIKQYTERLIALANTSTVSGNDPEAAKAYLKAELNRLQADGSSFSNLSFAGLDGMSYISDGTPVSVVERDYYKAIMGGKDLFFSEPVINKNNNKLSILIAVSVKKDGQLVRILMGTMDLDKLSQEVASMKTGNIGSAFIIDSRGICIAHPDEGMLNQDLTQESSTVPAQLAELIRNMTVSKAGKADYSFNGVDTIYHYQSIPLADWILVVAADRNEIYGPINALTRNIIITIVITSLLLLVLGWIQTVRISRPINDLVEATKRLAQGDLNTEIAINTQDEIGHLARSFEGMRQDLQVVIGKVAQVSSQVFDTARALASQAEQTAAAATTNVSTVSEISSTVENVVESIKELSEQAEEASQQADQGQKSIEMVINTMQEMKQSANQMSVSMSTLNEAVGNVGQFVETINAIAGQTNLLALNAAIEAARAGDAGLGFAVVADEVRKLAESSAQSAGEISRIISEMQQQSARAAADMEKSKENVVNGDRVVKEVGQSLVSVIELVQEFNLKAKDLATAAGQVSGAVHDVTATAEEQTAAMEEVSAAAAQLNSIAAELEETMKKFKS